MSQWLELNNRLKQKIYGHRDSIDGLQCQNHKQ